MKFIISLFLVLNILFAEYNDSHINCYQQKLKQYVVTYSVEIKNAQYAINTSISEYYSKGFILTNINTQPLRIDVFSGNTYKIFVTLIFSKCIR